MYTTSYFEHVVSDLDERSKGSEKKYHLSTSSCDDSIVSVVDGNITIVQKERYLVSVFTQPTYTHIIIIKVEQIFPFILFYFTLK